ncbi:MAG: NAD(P)-dependent oxidoreductase [Bacteroidota bacterium]
MMNSHKRNIWVFGGTGFIGSALVGRLLENPGNRIHTLVHKRIPGKKLESVNTFSGDLRTFDLTWLEKYPPDIVFHLARLGGANSITRYFAARQGATANRRLIQFFRSTPKPPKIIYVSGSLIYGHQPEGVAADETAPLSPVAYARYYMTGEQPWIEAQKERTLDVRFARPGWIVGPESWFKVFYWDYFQKTGKVPVYGDGMQMMSLIDVEDCAEQIANFGLQGNNMLNLNIFSGPPVSQFTFARSLAEILNAGIETISQEQLQRMFGRTVREALTSSIPLTSCFPEIRSLTADRYPTMDAMLRKTLSFLKNKERILSESP